MKIHNGNNIDILKTYSDNYFDSVVTDPPYGIEFLAKEWDQNTGAVETWEQCLRVLKPGGYILAFSAARTYHNLATNIEGVGFEIRDQLMWLYSSGFPKAQDLGKSIQRRQGVEKTMSLAEYEKLTGVTNLPKGDQTFGHNDDTDGQRPAGLSGKITIPTSPEAKQWSGWKTALKPAHEPIVMARKPFKGSAIDNVLTHGVGALNIDATRVEYDGSKLGNPNTAKGVRQQKGDFGNGMLPSQTAEWHDQGRFPSNVIGEVEGYQKFFYCPKVNRAERHIGFETAYTTGDAMRELGGRWENQKTAAGMKAVAVDKDGNTIPQVTLQTMVESKASGNNHPTVKPVELMKYLVTLVTPEGGKVLDPFTGSGSTGMAAVELGYDFTGCELDPDYVDIATRRITAWKNKTDLNNNPLPEQWFTIGE